MECQGGVSGRSVSGLSEEESGRLESSEEAATIAPNSKEIEETEEGQVEGPLGTA